MPDALYLDTSAVLRAVVETGTSPVVEERIRGARLLVTSRLSAVEAARALVRLRLSSAASRGALGRRGARDRLALGAVQALGADARGMRARVPRGAWQTASGARCASSGHVRGRPSSDRRARDAHGRRSVARRGRRHVTRPGNPRPFGRISPCASCAWATRPLTATELSHAPVAHWHDVPDPGSPRRNRISSTSCESTAAQTARGAGAGVCSPLARSAAPDGSGSALVRSDPARPPVVKTAVARAAVHGGASSVLDASGYVTARRQATVSAKITGKVVEVMIEEGQRVNEGDVLARLDDTEASSAALARARAAHRGPLAARRGAARCSSRPSATTRARRSSTASSS